MAKQYMMLDEEDVRLLSELLIRERRRVQNTENRPGPQDILPKAPDVYVAKAPVGGIDGIDAEAGTGTGTGTLGFPNYGECEIYRRGMEGNYAKLFPTGKTQRVYSLSAVAGSSWVLIERDKYGTWWATPEATAAEGGGGEISGNISGNLVRATVGSQVNSTTWGGTLLLPNPAGGNTTNGASINITLPGSLNSISLLQTGMEIMLQNATDGNGTLYLPQGVHGAANLSYSGVVTHSGCQSFGGCKSFDANGLNLVGSSQTPWGNGTLRIFPTSGTTNPGFTIATLGDGSSGLVAYVYSSSGNATFIIQPSRDFVLDSVGNTSITVYENGTARIGLTRRFNTAGMKFVGGIYVSGNAYWLFSEVYDSDGGSNLTTVLASINSSIATVASDVSTIQGQIGSVALPITAVSDAIDLTDIVTRFNELLANARTANALAT